MKRSMLFGLSVWLFSMSWALAVPPGKTIVIECDRQQLQLLQPLSFQQGAAARLLVQPKLSGASLDLTGITARWEARETMTTTVCYQATSVYTSNTAHTVAIDLTSAQTGTPVTNWVYSIILVSGGLDYPIGTGLVSIVASGFTGTASTVVTNAAAVLNTDAIYLAALTNLTAGAGITVSGSGHDRTLSSDVIKGTLSGTNGIYWVVGSVTNWILAP